VPGRQTDQSPVRVKFAGAAIVALMLCAGGGSSSALVGGADGTSSGQAHAGTVSQGLGKRRAESFLSVFASRVQCKGSRGPNEVCEAIFSGSRVRVTLSLSAEGRILLARCKIAREGSRPASKYACQHLRSEIGLSQSGPGTAVPKG
jgi:hypothetical protein